MRHRLLIRVLAGFLALSLVVVGGLASAKTITHESQHAHHQKATHASAFCSWMCAAGQVGETAAVFVPIATASQESVELPTIDLPPILTTSRLATRAPPLR